jgi:hypothetical protein
MAALTGDSGQEHPAGVFFDAVTTTAGHEDPLGFVRTPMATRAVQLKCLLQCHHLVLDLSVALLALHVVLRDVHLVKEGGIIEFLDSILEIMAGPTTLLLRSPIPFGDTRVALGA